LKKVLKVLDELGFLIDELEIYEKEREIFIYEPSEVPTSFDWEIFSKEFEKKIKPFVEEAYLNLLEEATDGIAIVNR
jgi:hypothetical protein